MREHRSRRRRGRVIRFPVPAKGYDEEIETAAFVEGLATQMMPRLQYFRSWLDAVKRSGNTKFYSIEVLLSIEREMFSALALLWAGLPPRQADQFVARLAPSWAQIAAVMAANHGKPSVAIARRRMHANEYPLA